MNSESYVSNFHFRDGNLRLKCAQSQMEGISLPALIFSDTVAKVRLQRHSENIY